MNNSLLVVVASLLAVQGCSSDAGGTRRSGAPAAGAGGSGGSAGSPTAGTGAGFGNPDGTAGLGGAAGAGGSGEQTCGGESYQGEVKSKLDIFIVFDLSGSMFGAGATGGWGPAGMAEPTIFEAVSPAIKAFVEDPQSAGIGVALRSFNDSCDVDALATPEVPMSDLPGNAQAIASWLDAQWAMYMPQGYGGTMNFMGTNTYPAMQGGIQHQTQWAVDHPDSKAVILLVTDGEPEDDCGSDDVPGIAAEGFAAGIPTYVLGLGNIASLNEVAVSGGTAQAFVVSDPAAAATQVAEQLNAIRGQAQPLPCTFLIPEGGQNDTNKVNLDYIAEGGAPLRLPRVDDAAACAGQMAWHYDNTAAPTSIVACDAACTEFVGSGGQVDIEIGCPTVVVQ